MYQLIKYKFLKRPLTILIFSVLAMTLNACQQVSSKKIKSATSGEMQMDNKPGQQLYTCPMHPRIREKSPGKCPICGMTLIPVKNNAPVKGKSADTSAELEVSPREQFLAGIKTDTARLTSLNQQIQLTGTTIFDPTGETMISAWVSGWIVKSYVRNPGEMIHAGEQLYDLYSPELLSAENDYQLTLKQDSLFKSASVDLTSTLQAMKQKLIRWGLSSTQINDLSKQQPTGRVSIYSKVQGYLVQKIKDEGDKVIEGDPVMSVAENNTIWVQAQVYDNELPLLQNNPHVWVEFNVLPEEKIPGEIVFNNPTIQNDSRVHLVNIHIPNPAGKIQPDMLAYVYLQTDHSLQRGTIVPSSAVVYDADKDYVWVQKPENKFERIAVQLGSNNETSMEILQGILPGEIVVSQGAYLLNSEYTLKYGTGVNMAGMQMSDMKMSGRSHQ